MELILQLPYRVIFVGLLTAMTLAVFAFFAYRPTIADYGWQRVQPGPMHWAMLPLSGLLSAFLLAVMFHGGAPPVVGEYLIFDALLALATGMAVWLPFHIRAIKHNNIQWRDNWIAFTDREGRQVQDMRDIVRSYEHWDNHIIVGFADGVELKIDPYCRGAEQLCEAILQQTEAMRFQLYSDRTV